MKIKIRIAACHRHNRWTEQAAEAEESILSTNIGIAYDIHQNCKKDFIENPLIMGKMN